MKGESNCARTSPRIFSVRRLDWLLSGLGVVKMEGRHRLLLVLCVEQLRSKRSARRRGSLQRSPLGDAPSDVNGRRASSQDGRGHQRTRAGRVTPEGGAAYRSAWRLFDHAHAPCAAQCEHDDVTTALPRALVCTKLALRSVWLAEQLVGPSLVGVSMYESAQGSPGSPSGACGEELSRNSQVTRLTIRAPIGLCRAADITQSAIQPYSETSRYPWFRDTKELPQMVLHLRHRSLRATCISVLSMPRRVD